MKEKQIYTRKGKFYIPSTTVDNCDKLPAGVYTIRQNPISKEYYFEVADTFTKPKKIYGSTMVYVERFLRTYRDRRNNTGILLMGEKGSGKTLTGKMLSLEAMKLGIPTIIVNEAHCGEEFNTFIQSIEQECIIMFDEFEKTYSYEAQKTLLTLLDGVFPTKKLFLLTANENHIDYNMQNRPGRIYYKIQFGKLEADFVREYCKDNLVNLAHLDDLMKLYVLFEKFNFDMMVALVEEINRFDETPIEAAKWLNIAVEGRSQFSVSITYRGKPYTDEQISPSTWTSHPLHSSHLFFEIDDDTLAPEDEWYALRLGQEDLQKINPNQGTYVYQKDEFVITLQKKKDYKYDPLQYSGSGVFDWS